MFHMIDDNILYDFVSKKEFTASLVKGKQTFDICQFLDDISIWIDHNREFISEKFLPLAVMSVGTNQHHISAFIYGFFIGKAMEKNKTKLKLDTREMSKEEVMNKMENDLQKYSDLFGWIDKKDGQDEKREEKSGT